MSTEKIIEEITDNLKSLSVALEQLDIKGAAREKIIEPITELLVGMRLNSFAPISNVRWVPIEKVTPNNYNPNSVAPVEMKLLKLSIAEDGYTQPVVTIYDPDLDVFVIVDGFHRYFTMKSNKDIYDKYNGMLPIVVISKSINNRMASTVRHNRARGKHSVDGMSNMVFQMLDEGWDDSTICNQLGMEPEEIIKLKHITGFSKLFENSEYSKAWKSRSQAIVSKASKEQNGG